MKPSLLILVLLVVAACEKSPTTTLTQNPLPQPTPAPITPAPLPQAAAVAAIPQPTPEPNWLAPDGVWFLLAAKSIETDDGLIGLKPGTKLIKQADGSYLSDGRKVTAENYEVTNDLRVAQQIKGADASAQAAIRNSLAALPATAPAVASPTVIERKVYVHTPAKPAPTPENPTDRGAYGEKKVFTDKARTFNIRRY